jgi:hypothetical protein
LERKRKAKHHPILGDSAGITSADVGERIGGKHSERHFAGGRIWRKRGRGNEVHFGEFGEFADWKCAEYGISEFSFLLGRKKLNVLISRTRFSNPD